jgi:hypothetical protein
MVMNFVSYKLCKLFVCLMRFQMFFVCIYNFPQFTPLLLRPWKAQKRGSTVVLILLADQTHHLPANKNASVGLSPDTEGYKSFYLPIFSEHATFVA